MKKQLRTAAAAVSLALLAGQGACQKENFAKPDPSSARHDPMEMVTAGEILTAPVRHQSLKIALCYLSLL